MKKLSIIFAILILTITGFSQTKYNTYSNARFGYTISYPASLIPQGEADNGWPAPVKLLQAEGENQLT